MKKIVLLLAVVMLLLSGCSPQPEETLDEYMKEFSVISDDLTLGSADGGNLNPRDIITWISQKPRNIAVFCYLSLANFTHSTL